MRSILARWVLKVYLLLQKGDCDMMALLFAQRVILGKTTFAEVPAKLKAQVAEILVNESGLPELVSKEFGGTMEETVEE